MSSKKKLKLFLGKTCPRCKKGNVIFTGVEKSASQMLPVRGGFLYPCRYCSWTMTCDVEKLEEYSEEEIAAQNENGDKS